ncbi:MAG TPA: hypothetical protein VNF29_01950 [Candidatus Binataceae bacterium]|nr:hypothetical protein [Candidatus Binataceae bacterium]
MSLRKIRLRKTVCRGAVLLGFAIAAGGCAYSLVNGGTVNQAKADQVEEGIQQLRQLHFKTPVPLVVATQDEAEAQMRRELERDNTDDEIAAEGASGALLGLYPAGIDLKAQDLKLLRSQVAGFYDPHEHEMVLVEGAADIGFFDRTAEFLVQRDLVGEMVLAHELTHALQDQNFDLGARLDALKHDDDRALALQSVAEGDATIAGLGYAMGTMDVDTLDRLQSRLDELPGIFASETPGTPRGLSAPLLFQYSEGVKFVGEAYRRGGWKAVDALYAKPPESSHQIIHPEAYFGTPEPPQKVSLGGYQSVMAQWKKVDESTYGELLISVILQRGLGSGASEAELATRWTGDRFIVLQDERMISVIGIIAFTDSGAAGKFAVTYTRILDRLLGSTAHEIDYRDNGVLIVIGEAAHYMGILGPSIWKASTIGGHPVANAAMAGRPGDTSRNHP